MYLAFLLPPDEIVEGLKLDDVSASLASEVQVAVNNAVVVLYKEEI